MVLSFLLILVVFPLVYSVMMDMSPFSWSICFWSLCCHAGGPPLGFLLVVGFGGVILLVISKTAVYCIWLMVVRSKLSVNVSPIILSKVLTTLFSFFSFFSLDSFFLSFIIIIIVIIIIIRNFLPYKIRRIHEKRLWHSLWSSRCYTATLFTAHLLVSHIIVRGASPACRLAQGYVRGS